MEPGLTRSEFTLPKPLEPVKVVLFSGGRGSSVLSRAFVMNPSVGLTIAVNGYDDGASTGEVRRFLRDSLGPSDFRKNASRMARVLQTCPPELLDLLAQRLPDPYSHSEGAALLNSLRENTELNRGEFEAKLSSQFSRVNRQIIDPVRNSLARFEDELDRCSLRFNFSDCSIGNLVFAGCFMGAHRRFNNAVEDYCRLLNLPPGLLENVTDGTNAFLVAIDHDNRILASEAEIVDADRRNHVDDIYLIGEPLTDEDTRSLNQSPREEIHTFLKNRGCRPAANPRLIDRIKDADLVVYSPGTQHSSLFPSYLTPGIGAAIAGNLQAIKLLITNIQEDAEIPDSTAVDLIAKALYYLRNKNHNRILSPCLITHYLVNDPSQTETETPYVPLGQIQSLEDPRLVRIANFEEGDSGRHNAEKVIGPFLETLVKKRASESVAVVLLDTESLDKITQTILEALRNGLSKVATSVSIFYSSEEPLPPELCRTLPFSVVNTWKPGESSETSLLRAVRNQPFDYVLLFESSGMYRGEDIVNLISLLDVDRLDAVWGSRRLSVSDIHESYRLRYRRHPFAGVVSYLGSHLLSLCYLLLYGRYISDTLSGVRAVRTTVLESGVIDLQHKMLNQHLLSLILRDRGEILETPVLFFPMSPQKVKRTTAFEGLWSVATTVIWRLRSLTKQQTNSEVTAELGGVEFNEPSSDSFRSTSPPSKN